MQVDTVRELIHSATKVFDSGLKSVRLNSGFASYKVQEAVKKLE